MRAERCVTVWARRGVSVLPTCLCRFPKCNSAAGARWPSSWRGPRSACRRSCEGRGQKACRRTGSVPPRCPYWTCMEQMKVSENGSNLWANNNQVVFTSLVWKVQVSSRSAGPCVTNALESQLMSPRGWWSRLSAQSFCKSSQAEVRWKSNASTPEWPGPGTADYTARCRKWTRWKIKTSGRSTKRTKQKCKESFWIINKDNWGRVIVHLSAGYHQSLSVNCASHQGAWPDCRKSKKGSCWSSRSHQRWISRPGTGSHVQSNLKHENRKIITLMLMTLSSWKAELLLGNDNLVNMMKGRGWN